MAFPFDLQSRLQIDDNPLVICGCGRSVNLDMMRDVRPVKKLLGLKDDYVCDSCMEHFHRNDILSREDYYRANGAPEEIVAIHAARDAVIKAARDDALKGTRDDVG
jgi:hypothetical protein